MLSPDKESFEFGIRVVTAVVTSTVAVLVFRITRQQAKTAREKLRLDLYEKRFAIYTRTFDFYNALILWKDTEEQKALIGPFYRSYREAKFLFPESSGVYAFMDEFSKHAFQVSNFEYARDSMQSLPREQVELALKRTEHVNWIAGSLGVLEERLGPFLNFHDTPESMKTGKRGLFRRRTR